MSTSRPWNQVIDVLSFCSISVCIHLLLLVIIFFSVLGVSYPYT